MSIIKTIFAPVIVIFKILRSLIVYRVRLGGILASNFFDLVKDHARIYSFEEEFVIDRLPNQFDAFGLMDGIPFRLMIEERLLRAGFRGTDVIIHVKFFRFHKKRAVTLLRQCGEMVRADLPVYLMSQWGSSKLSSLKNAKDIDLPYLEAGQYVDIMQDMEMIVKKDLDKFGVILHGSPGNGKSYFIRYLAMKFRLPLYIVALDPEWTNADVIRNLSQVEGPAIMLFEDFDNHFDNRQPIREVKYSFDSILNALDGAYTVFNNVAVFMTANDINKVDEALKARPSRFKYIRNISNPEKIVIERIFGDGLDGELPKGGEHSLDVLLHAKDMVNEGHNLEVAMLSAHEYSRYARKSKEKERMIAEQSKTKEERDTKAL